ncbi:MAG: ester cyclase [Chloroflexota bacterium]
MHLTGRLLLAGLLLAAGAATPAASHAAAQDATPATPAACAAMTSDQSREVAAAFMDRLNASDLDGMAAMVAPDAVYSSATQGEKTGPRGVADALGAILQAYPDAVHETKAVIADGNAAVVRWTARGINTGPLLGREPTGEAREWEGMFLFRMECGLIAGARSAVEQAAALGLPGADARQEPDAPAATPGPCEPMSREAMRAAVATFWTDGWNAGNVAVSRELAAPGIVQHWVTGDDTRGADAGAVRLEALFAGMPDLAISWDDILVDGDLAAAAWTWRGTDTGGMFGQPPTGRAVDYDGISIFRFACGKIAETWTEGDVNRMLAQLAGS